MGAQSVTNEEIARYWKQRHMLEEDHLFAAIKAAARLRARNLSEEDYLQFEESIREEEKLMSKGERRSISMVGVKDWWTKSKYAYLNQPAVPVKSVVDLPTRRTTQFHVPQYSFTFKSASLPQIHIST